MRQEGHWALPTGLLRHRWQSDVAPCGEQTRELIMAGEHRPWNHPDHPHNWARRFSSQTLPTGFMHISAIPPTTETDVTDQKPGPGSKPDSKVE